jgi:UDP-N-acetylglucosamine 4-epimerase
VTGVAGFIGSHLLERLLQLNQKVVGLDNFSTGTPRNLEDVLKSVSPKQQKNFTFYEGDICRIKDCEKAIKNVDFVLHQAALGSVPRSIEFPEMFHHVNVDGFVNMLMAAKKAKKTKIKRFVYASSSSVYGDSPSSPKVESQIGNLLSPYAVSKYTNELYASVFGRCYGLQTIGLRYFTVFGPRQDPKGPYAAVIPLWFSAILSGNPVCVYGDGETSRDFCYVENVVQANLLAALTTRSEACDQVYNIAVGERTTLNQLVGYIQQLLGKSGAKINYQDFRAGDIRHSLASIDKAKKLLGYFPSDSVKQGLEKTRKYYEEILN